MTSFCRTMLSTCSNYLPLLVSLSSLSSPLSLSRSLKYCPVVGVAMGSVTQPLKRVNVLPASWETIAPVSLHLSLCVCVFLSSSLFLLFSLSPLTLRHIRGVWCQSSLSAEIFLFLCVRCFSSCLWLIRFFLVCAVLCCISLLCQQRCCSSFVSCPCSVRLVSDWLSILICWWSSPFSCNSCCVLSFPCYDVWYCLFVVFYAL